MTMPALVQIGELAEKFPIVTDTLSIGQDRIPDGRHDGIFGPGNGKVELPLANSLNWLRVSLERKRDVKKRYSVGAQERFEGCEKGDGYAFRR
jgi:hypothetical protein